MEVCPDFGYEGDNYFLEKDEEAPRNWKLITEIISSKRKHEWLRNFSRSPICALQVRVVFAMS